MENIERMKSFEPERPTAFWMMLFEVSIHFISFQNSLKIKFRRYTINQTQNGFEWLYAKWYFISLQFTAQNHNYSIPNWTRHDRNPPCRKLFSSFLSQLASITEQKWVKAVMFINLKSIKQKLLLSFASFSLCYAACGVGQTLKFDICLIWLLGSVKTESMSSVSRPTREKGLTYGIALKNINDLVKHDPTTCYRNNKKSVFRMHFWFDENTKTVEWKLLTIVVFCFVFSLHIWMRLASRGARVKLIKYLCNMNFTSQWRQWATAKKLNLD